MKIIFLLLLGLFTSYKVKDLRSLSICNTEQIHCDKDEETESRLKEREQEQRLPIKAYITIDVDDLLTAIRVNGKNIDISKLPNKKNHLLTDTIYLDLKIGDLIEINCENYPPYDKDRNPGLFIADIAYFDNKVIRHDYTGSNWFCDNEPAYSFGPLKPVEKIFFFEKKGDWIWSKKLSSLKITCKYRLGGFVNGDKEFSVMPKVDDCLSR